MRMKETPGGNRGISNAGIAEISNALRGNIAFVFKQCYGAGLHVHACQACEQRGPCYSEAGGEVW